MRSSLWSRLDQILEHRIFRRGCVKEVGVLEEVGVAMVVAVAKAEGAKVPGS